MGTGKGKGLESPASPTLPPPQIVPAVVGDIIRLGVARLCSMHHGSSGGCVGPRARARARSAPPDWDHGLASQEGGSSTREVQVQDAASLAAQKSRLLCLEEEADDMDHCKW